VIDHYLKPYAKSLEFDSDEFPLARHIIIECTNICKFTGLNASKT